MPPAKKTDLLSQTLGILRLSSRSEGHVGEFAQGSALFGSNSLKDLLPLQARVKEASLEEALEFLRIQLSFLGCLLLYLLPFLFC